MKAAQAGLSEGAVMAVELLAHHSLQDDYADDGDKQKQLRDLITKVSWRANHRISCDWMTCNNRRLVVVMGWMVFFIGPLVAMYSMSLPLPVLSMVVTLISIPLTWTIMERVRTDSFLIDLNWLLTSHQSMLELLLRPHHSQSPSNHSPI